VIQQARNTEPKVGVVVLTYNRMVVLKSCLSSVLRSNYQNYVTIVVDNASTDGTSAMIKSYFPSARLVRSEVNLGYTGGNNLGIKYLLEREDCDYILILNDDTIIDSNLMNELVGVVEKDQKIGIANPGIFDFETRSKLHNHYGKYNFYLGIGYHSLLNKSEPEEIGLMRGTCFLLREEVVEKIGLMDEGYFLYFDEADLSCRVKKAGYRLMYVPSARAYHKMSHSFSGTINPVALYYSTRNELLFARKNLNILLFFPLWAFRFVFRIMQYLFKTWNPNVVSAIFRGFVDSVRGIHGKSDLMDT
jgi:GT2 family glycosyltransferase